MIYRLAISIALCAMLAACGTSASIANEFPAPTRTADQERQLLEAIGHSEIYIADQLDVGLIDSFDKVDHVTFLYLRPFAGAFAISIQLYPEEVIEFEIGERTTIDPFALLYVAERWNKQLPTKERSGSIQTISNIHHFSKELSPEAFARMNSTVASSRFSEAAPLPPPTLGTDGSSYLIVVSNAGSTKRVWRSEHHKSFEEDIEIVRELFDFARKEVPDAQSIIDQVWNEIQTEHLR